MKMIILLNGKNLPVTVIHRNLKELGRFVCPVHARHQCFTSGIIQPNELYIEVDVVDIIDPILSILALVNQYI